MNNRRAQLSIETMIIYGLVILVALSVIGGLLYFNILDLGSYLPDKCDLGGSGDLKCEEMMFAGGTLELGIRNIGQKPVDYLNITVTDGAKIHFTDPISAIATYGTPIIKVVDYNEGLNAVALAPGEIAKVTFSTRSALKGKLLRGSLVSKYRFSEGAIIQQSSGSIRVKSS
jgi:hypothetical protein